MALRRWGAEVLVNLGVTGNQIAPDVAALADGSFVAVWVDDNAAPSAIRAQRFTALGDKLGAEFEVGTAIAGAHSAPSVAALADGNFLVSFVASNGANNNIEGEVWSAAGSLVRSQQSIAASGLDDDPDAAALGSGAVVVWRDPNGNFDQVNDPTKSSDILVRTFDAVGVGGAVATANLVNISVFGDQNDFDPVVATSAAGMAVVWRWTAFGSPTSDIYASIYNASGVNLAKEISLCQVTSGDQEMPAVTWLNGGTFAVAWVDRSGALPGSGYDIRCRVFNSSGVGLTNDILVNGTLASGQTQPAIAALANGGFVIAWTDLVSHTGGDASGSSIKMQAFDGAGNKSGGEIVVNTTAALDQSDVTLATLADGRIAVSWTDGSAGSSDIRMQIVDPRDGTVTGGSGDDLLYGHDGFSDEMFGGDGNDTMNGLGGGDTCYGGGGNDRFSGGRGDDTAFGGLGNDDLRGNGGDDVLKGEDGNDALRGNNGDDELYGGASADTLFGGRGADLLDGGAATDTASYAESDEAVVISLDGTLAAEGDAFGDILTAIENIAGSTASDTLRGNALANTLDGKGGSDTLDGSGGNDRIIGGLDIDVMTGGIGNDIFVYSSQAEAGDMISDFSAVTGNNDRFEFLGSAFGGLAAGSISATQFQNNGSSTAATAAIRFVYDSAAHKLYFDSDGSGANASLLVATLQPGAVVVLGDFAIV